jgi:hypothetical protein
MYGVYYKMGADTPIPPDMMNPAAPEGASCAAVLVRGEC